MSGIPSDYFGIRVVGQGQSYGVIRRMPSNEGPRVQTEVYGLEAPRVGKALPEGGATATQRELFWQAVEHAACGDREAALEALKGKRGFGENVTLFYVIAR